jgi:hypothetical protein
LNSFGQLVFEKLEISQENTLFNIDLSNKQRGIYFLILSVVQETDNFEY